MHEAVTVGMIVWPLLAIVGIGAVLAVLFVILSIYGNMFNH